MTIGEDIVRVIRIVEYVGPRSAVERQIEGSLHGTKKGIYGPNGAVQITAVTLGLFPEIIGKVVKEARDDGIEDALGFNDVRLAS